MSDLLVGSNFNCLVLVKKFKWASLLCKACADLVQENEPFLASWSCNQIVFLSTLVENGENIARCGLNEEGIQLEIDIAE